MDGNPKIDWHSLTGGSFNYCDPGIKPSSSNGRNNLAGWAEYIWRGVGHALKYYAIDHVKDNPDRALGIMEILTYSPMYVLFIDWLVHDIQNFFK